MVAYIRSFAKHFDLERYVQLKTEVRQIEPVDKNGMVDWRVRLVGRETRNYSALAPGIANLYFNGLVTSRGGNQPIHSATGKLIASCVHAQWSLDHPIVNEFAESWAPESRIDYVPELIRGVKCSMHVSEGIVRRHDPTDS